MTIPLPREGFLLTGGGRLRELTVAYETYGELSADRDNAVLICHALTGDAHVAGVHGPDDRKPGWWDEMVGPGKGIDTDHYFVLCANVLGGCRGTTGPASPDPETGRPYGSSFPAITVTDMVRVQKLLLDALGIDRLAAVVGGSFGGMQALEWSVRFPERVARCICIATAASLSTQALAFDLVARDAIVSDPNWRGGDFYGATAGPDWGLAHARKIGHITYLSPGMMQEKFGRERVAVAEGEPHSHHVFQVESYLDYQGDQLVKRFDANSYLHITRAMDAYDLAEEYGSLDRAFADVRANFLVVALSSDWLFPPEQSYELANALLHAGKHVSCCTLKAPHGHDAFLVDIEHLAETVRAFLPWVTPRPSRPVGEADVREALGCGEFRLIEGIVPNGSRVADLACGDGRLLSLLAVRRGTRGFGVEISLANVISVIDRGHDVFQGDLDDGLSVLPDRSYDFAILSNALQEVKRPRLVLREMARVAGEVIVTFPNFAHWQNRLCLGLRGRMPKSRALPFEWYDTPNIHLTTLGDFTTLCRDEGLEIVETVCLPASAADRLLLRLRLCNLGAQRVLARVRRPAGRPSAAGPSCACATACCRVD